MSGVLVSAADPQSIEWHAARVEGIGSSEIAAILGLSPYASPFDLWWQKKLREVREPDEAMRWGTRIEPAIREAWADAHPEFSVTAAPGVFAHPSRPWQRCSPDGLVCERPTSVTVREWGSGRIVTTLADDATDRAVAVLECKSDHNRAGWGEPGTDAIPAHYACQVQWQMDVLGLPVAYVAVSFGSEPLEYEVAYDAGDCELMREAARAFLASLDTDTPPPLDAHTATTRRLKSLHPDLADTEAEIAPDVIDRWLAAKAVKKGAEAEIRFAENEIRAALADARVGLVDGEKAVSRSIYTVPEQTREAYTVDRLNASRRKD